jgi:bacteriorhodopsin
MAGNDALQANPITQNNVEEHITVRGSDWLWAVFAIMLFTDLIVIGWHFMVPRGQRIFHQMAAVSLPSFPTRPTMGADIV